MHGLETDRAQIRYSPYKICCVTGHIVRGHVAIITKPSPHYVITESTTSGRNVVLIPGLLPIFLHGCEIKSGCGLGTRLVLSTMQDVLGLDGM